MSPSTLDLFCSSAASTAGKNGVKCSKGDTSHIYKICLYIMFVYIHFFTYIHLQMHDINFEERREHEVR